MSNGMNLAVSCRPLFKANDQVLGNFLKHRQCVELTAVGKSGAMAIVEGSSDEDYIVGVDFSKTHNGQLGVHCDCPRFASGHPCKHLWAVLSKIDQEYDLGDLQVTRLRMHGIDVSLLDVGSERDKGHPGPSARRTGRGVRSTREVEVSPTSANSNSTYRTVTTRTSEPKSVTISTPAKAKAPSWKLALHEIGKRVTPVANLPHEQIPSDVFKDAKTQHQHWFVLSVADEVNQRHLQIDVLRSSRKNDGHWGKPIPCNILSHESGIITDAGERAAFSLLVPLRPQYSYHRYSDSGSFVVKSDVLDESLQLLHATGRFAWKLGATRYFEDARVFKNVDVQGEPWRLQLSLSPSPDKDSQLVLAARLQRAHETIPLERLMLASEAGYAVVQEPTQTLTALTNNDAASNVSANNDAATNELAADEVVVNDPASSIVDASIIKIDPENIAALRAWQQNHRLTVPRRSLNTLLAELAQTHAHLDLEIDPTLEVIQATAIPSGRCLLRQREHRAGIFDAAFYARYQEHDVSFDAATKWWWDTTHKQLTRRCDVPERALLRTIPVDAFQITTPLNGYHDNSPTSQTSLSVPREHFIQVVETLRAAQWEVFAEGSPIRIATDFNVSVSSGTDWFDLNAQADFDGITASLPQLLAALQSGNHTFVLDDGTLGMLPEAWLKKFAGMQASGEITEDGIRFNRTQALLLDAMLSEQADVSYDRSFTEFCDKLKAFTGIAPANPPDTFNGELRPYQQLGLGWFAFLREFRFGGCLADDMGLGKTIQVLSLLEGRRTRELAEHETRKPSLAVVPKSLIFNWIDEASKFTPNLHVLNYTGTDRTERLAAATQNSDSPLDLILTTYGTLRRDAAELRETEFDYVILDEAQAIKNPQSQAAKASRLLQGEHRLAMTGTPVENHLGDLWSLFDFLNPGMLGSTPRIAQLSDDEDRQRITHVSQSLRPFILRRTKAQVLTELPEKVEQTLACEMEPKQRKLYAQLKEHYRLHLSKKVEELGLQRSKIHVLEALLRLRQAACDPRLVNPDCGVTGAKIIQLMEQLEEVIGEGHKVLVFSQFTKLLALVRQELDARRWQYEYLDGKTQKRSEHVKRFQEDDDCKLFLISLKAGGNGLNLTAADYVYILDPWWNPAVEAQAIDRAHRMGQSKSVMAYRMICEETVEAKIIQMQQSKRDLADAIINQDKSLISNLTAEDLQQLLS